MKIALVISSLSSGGAERTMSLLANHWAAQGENVCLITMGAITTDCYALHPGVQRIALDLMRDSNGMGKALANNWKRINALRGVLAEIAPHVILSFQHETNLVALLASRGLRARLIISERTDPTKHRVGRCWAVLRRLLYPFADALVVQTNAVLPWAHSVMRRRLSAVVRNPVRDMSEFDASDAAVNAATVVAVGRLQPEKGFDLLIRAFAHIAPQFPELSLVIAGQGPERSSLIALAAQLGIAGRVEFRGWISEPGDLFTRARLFVLSSRYEGFPNALLEAMACGVPVVSTACAGPLEIVTDEVDGLIVPVESAEALAEAMSRALADPGLSGRLSRNARGVTARFSIEAVAREWETVFNPAAGRDLQAPRRAPAA